MYRKKPYTVIAYFKVVINIVISYTYKDVLYKTPLCKLYNYAKS